MTKSYTFVNHTQHLSPYGGDMEAMARQSWTDDRIEERFDRVEGQISDLRIEIKGLRGGVEQRGNELRTEIKEQGNELRTEITEQGRELRAELAAGDAGLRQEMIGVEARLRTQMGEHQAIAQEQFGRLHEDVTAMHRTMARIGWSVGFAMVAAMVSLLISYH